MTSLEHNFKEREYTELIINQQMERILADPQFAGSDILKRFLSFVVSETLGGRSNTIKEYTIAIKVLDKAVDFNPQHDAIVRIHAGRLRRALHQYYKGAGASDSLCISMPKGSYLPVFEQSENNVDAAQAPGNLITEPPLHKPIVMAVLPFSHYDTNSSHVSFSNGVGELLSNELSRFQDISVISYYTMRNMPGEIIDAKLFEPAFGIQYAIAGNSQFQGGNLRINIELIDVRTSRTGLEPDVRIQAQREEYVCDTG